MRNTEAAKAVSTSKKHSRAVRQEAVAFGIIRGLSALTIVVLAGILGFILFKGLRYSNIERSDYLAYAESAPDGLVIAANAAQDIEELDWTTLYGMFTDEYINWAKIDQSDVDLTPVAIDPSSAEGKAVQDFLFGSEADGGYPLWGGLVLTAASSAEALATVASTPGSVAIVPESAATGVDGIKLLRLRRIVMAVNPGVTELVENSRINDLSTKDSRRILSGEARNWKEFGGPDLAIAVIAPPAGSGITAVLTSAELAYAPEAGQTTSATDDASYAAAIAETDGAVGLMLAGRQGLAALPALTLTSVRRGWNLSFRYLVEAPRLSGKTGGISTIIGNTVFMLLLTILFAAPLGVAAAVYLVEYAKQGPLIRILRLGTETLAGIPSIIFGLFGFLFFVNILGFGFGLLSGSLTLTLMILPTIIRTSEEALKSVPRSLREGSLALGATKLQTIARVVLPAAAPGILTGLILAVGRAVGETAALLFTMGSDYQLAKGLFSSARGLSAHVYLLFSEGISFDRAFATATVLVLVVLVINFAARRVIVRMGRGGAA